MSAATDFARLKSLPPAEAVAYMAGRELVGETFNAYDLWRDQHGRAFTVSRLARADLLEALQQSLAKSVAGELSRRDWISSTEKLLKDAGWWGVKEVTDPRTGELLQTRFNHARLQLIFDTNVRQAQAAGQWQRLLRNRRTHPFARYVTMDDDRVRPLHRAWHGVTLPLDAPWWSTHRPPNGWRCRCRIIGVTQRDYDQGTFDDRGNLQDGDDAPLQQRPMQKQAPQDGDVEWRNPATGRLERIPRGVDPGFDYNAGTEGASRAFEELVQAKLARLSPGMRKAAEGAGIRRPVIAKEVPGQDSWKSLGLADLRTMKPEGSAPDLLPMAHDLGAAVQALREVLGVPVDGLRFVETPVGKVSILDRLLPHVVEKRGDARERYGRFILPTLTRPDEVWSTAYDDDTTRQRFIKLFAGAKYDILVVVREQADGSVLWNVINRDRKGMNALRVGTPVYRREGDE